MGNDPRMAVSQTLLDGIAAADCTAVPLRVGALDLLYEDGALRLIRLGDVEILRSVYMAVRDADWLTIPAQRANERIELSEDGFAISCECRYHWNDVRFEAHCQITGDADSLSFAMQGTALSAFRKNRIGLCVLHPIRECAGHDCRITTPDGIQSARAFPDLIDPHQPFWDIRAMQWQPARGCDASLEFEGEVFETEDQRNWTDASFKTYGTPLALPFPAQVQAGERFEQRVVLRVRTDRTRPRRQETVTFTPLDLPDRPLPRLGLGHSSEAVTLSESDIEAVRALYSAHLRADLPLYAPDWGSVYSEVREEAHLLGLPLELALFFGAEPEREMDSLLAVLTRFPMPLYSAALLHRDFKVTPPDLLETQLPRLRRALPGLLVGGGTDAYFAELNRERILASDLDFLCFSANPQVHAADNRTVLENPSALSDVVRSARAFAGGRAVHISPLTLTRRSNPDATGSPTAASADELEWGVDPRQSSLVGAGWALGSMKYLAEAGADSVSFCEVAGLRGVIGRQGIVHPLYFVLREIWGGGHTRILPSASDDPLRVDGLMLRDGTLPKMLLSNLTPETQKVRIKWNQDTARLRMLDEITVAAALSDPRFFDGGESVTAEAGGWITLALPPYALALLASAVQ